MHKFLVLLWWWAVGLLHAHANEDFFFNDEGFPSTFLEPDPPPDDINSPWSMQNLFTDTSLVSDNNACSADTSRFFAGRKRIRSIICSGDPSAGGDVRTSGDDQTATSDPDLQNIIKDLEMPLTDNDDSAVTDYDNGGIQQASICPDTLHLGHVLPVCSSEFKKDIFYTPITGEAKLNWCTLSMFFRR